MTSWTWHCAVLLIYLLANAQLATSDGEHYDECRHSLSPPAGFFRRHFSDFSFLKKFFQHWIPFTRDDRVKMRFILYKRDFAICGREIVPYDDEKLEVSAFDSKHPTRIIIHGWMSKPKGSLNRQVKNAYLSLANMTQNDEEADTIRDYNVIVADWSVISSNVNYMEVVELIDALGFLLAELLRYLHMRIDLNMDDVYLIGHSLGAQIAGSAGRQIQPDMLINTIFALDPAGPLFRNASTEKRIDMTDARYVESIQTSNSLGFQQAVGHATFYPNYGHSQKNCYVFGCSHSRAHRYFAESITSRLGFWGKRCQRNVDGSFVISNNETEFRMGGEPSTPKTGLFYVKTRSKPPYAMGSSSTNIEPK